MMPAAIPFAFPNTMMPAATPAASAGAATAEGATAFGQLVDASAQPEADASADVAAPAVTALADAALPAAGSPGGVVNAAADVPQQAVNEPLADVAAEPLPDLMNAAGVGQAVESDEPAAPVTETLDPEAVAEAVSEPDLGLADLPIADEAMVTPARPADVQSDPALQASLDVPVVTPQEAVTDTAALLPHDAALDAAVSAESAAAPMTAALAEAAQNPTPKAATAQPDDTANDSSADPLLSAAASRKADSQFALARMADAAAAAEAADLADAGEAAVPSSGEESAPASALTAMASAKPAPVETSLPAALLTQAMSPIGQAPIAHGAHPYAATLAAVPPEPVVKAEPGRFGADVGVEIAKVAKGDGDSLFIRLDPRDMGRVDVRLSFDRDGVLRAVMSVDSPAALDMLRRESGELNRALTEAGVRSDSQSLRFDSRADSGAGQGGAQGDQARSGGGSGRGGHGEPSAPDYQPLRSTTQVDLIA